MLKCIPELTQFPEIQDPMHQENIMAATVILRQYEEMEEEMEEGEIGNHVYEGVYFLAITQTIIDTMISTPLDHSLATASYWIAIRQEVYYALTRQRAPQVRFDLEGSRKTSVANTMIVFASEVAKWRWGLKQPQEWGKLTFNFSMNNQRCWYQPTNIPHRTREAQGKTASASPGLFA